MQLNRSMPAVGAQCARPRRSLLSCARAAALLVATWLVASGAAAQQPVGQIDFAQGLTSAQGTAGEGRLVTRGDKLFKGDVVTTTDKGYVVLTLDDGTRMTLRPSSTFAVNDFSHGDAGETALLRLFKGGLRTITGLIGKRNPAGFRLQTPSATIGIRGTKFDARVCGEDCRDEQAQARARPAVRTPVPPPDTVVGRVVRLSGTATLNRAGEQPRSVSTGTPVLVGDQITTDGASSVVLGFRDQSRVSLEPQSAFKVDAFAFHHDPENDTFALRLLRGGLRAFNGLIAKARPSSVEYRAKTATIGIRGTGADLSCQGSCAALAEPVSETCRPNPPPPPPAPAPKAARGATKKAKPAAAPVAAPAPPACPDGLFVRNWDGSVFVAAGSNSLDIPLDVAAFVGSDGAPVLLSQVPDFMNNFVSPRPDTVEVDWETLFGGAPYDGSDGLYILVRDGYVLADGTPSDGGGGGGHIDLGPGEAAFIGPDGTPHRLVPTPAFLLDDPYPAPEVFNADSSLVLQLFGTTMGTPGQEVCEIK